MSRTTLAYSDYTDVFAAEIGSITASEKSAKLEINSKSRLLDVIVPYGGEDGIYVAYGRKTIRPTVLSGRTFTIANSDKQSLGTVHSVKSVASDGTKTDAPYTADLAACTITITGNDDIGTIECDITGHGNFTALDDILTHMLTSWIGVPASDIETSALGALPTTKLSVWESDLRPLASIIASSHDGRASLERSVNGLIYQAPNGKWTARSWTPTSGLLPIAHLRARDFQRFEPKPRHAHSIFGVVRVLYNYSPVTRTWSSVIAKDDALVAKVGHDESYDVYSYLVNSTDAIVLAQRMLFSLSIPPLDIAFTERGNKLANARLRDRVLVTYPRAPSATGELSGSVFEVTELRKDLTPGLAVSGVLSSLRLSDDFGIWVADGTPNFADATDEEKKKSGFWTKDDGTIGSEDAKSIWY